MPLSGFRNEDAPALNERLLDIAESLSATLAAFHTGRERAVKGPALCQRFGLSDAELRACVHYLRTRELVSSDSAGYYTPATLAEAERTIAHLTERRDSLSRIIDSQNRLLNRARFRAA